MNFKWKCNPMSHKEDAEGPPRPKKQRAAVVIPKTALDVQRMQLERLMEDPSKPVQLPDMKEERKPHEPPEFMRFYMGSSAGAGSEVFHIYRHLRRKETIRQNYISEQAVKEEKDREYEEKVELNRAQANEVTAKKRAKRLRRKQHQQEAKKQKKAGKSGEVVPKDDLPSKPEESSQVPSEGDDDDAEESAFVIGGR